jgi:hypothetical protein
MKQIGYTLTIEPDDKEYITLIELVQQAILEEKNITGSGCIWVYIRTENNMDYRSTARMVERKIRIKKPITLYSFTSFKPQKG